MVSPPDEHGFFSLGVSVDIARAAVDAAKLVIAQVNSFMPRTHGAAAIHVDEIDILVDHSEPLVEWPTGTRQVYKTIAAHIARLVPDGSTFQIGIGHIPDAVLAALGDKTTWAFTPASFPTASCTCADKGVVNGRRKRCIPARFSPVSRWARASFRLDG